MKNKLFFVFAILGISSSSMALNNECPGSKVFVELGNGFTVFGHNRIKGTSDAAAPTNVENLSIPYLVGESDASGADDEIWATNWPYSNEGNPNSFTGYLFNPSGVQSGSTGVGYNVYGTLGYDAKIGCTLLGVYAGGGYLGSGSNYSIPGVGAVFAPNTDEEGNDPDPVTDDANQDDDLPSQPAMVPANASLRIQTSGYVTAGIRLGYLFGKNTVGVNVGWAGVSTKATLTAPGAAKGNMWSNNLAQQFVNVKSVSRFVNGAVLGMFFERMITQNFTLGLAFNFFLMGNKNYSFANAYNWAPNTPDSSGSFKNRFQAYTISVTAKYTLPMSR